MKTVMGVDAVKVAEKLIQDLEESAALGEDFAITPEQSKRLAIILQYLIIEPVEDCGV